MQKLLLKHQLSPGDVLMLTAAVRDLHRSHPGRFLTDVRTSCDAMWEHNPYLTPLKDADPEVREIECHYPLIHSSNQQPYHFINGFVQFLNETLDLKIQLTEFRGDIHLSDEERQSPSMVELATGVDRPFWIVCAGGKYDYTIKWWNWRRYQAVVDHFRDRIDFVQVGEKGHYHPALKGVTDLRGKTTLRELIRLTHHASGILCGVTLHMHLAAAVPTRPGRSPARPAVIVAGGREAPQWEAYPSHQFLHTVGALPCCAGGGCWRSRSVPIGDGDEKDEENSLCVDVVDGLPHCMHLITPELVIQHMEMLLADGTADLANHGRNAARSKARPKWS